jgi:hypothetical protein
VDVALFLALMAAALFGGTLVYVIGLRRPRRLARVLGAGLAVAGPFVILAAWIATYWTGD